VILAQDLRIEQDYLTCSRAGQGTPLGKAQRRQVWQLAQQVESELSALGRSTFLQLANEATRFLHDSGEPLYRHVIIDEARTCTPRSGACCAPPSRPAPTTCSSSETHTSASTTTTCRSRRSASTCAVAAEG